MAQMKEMYHIKTVKEDVVQDIGFIIRRIPAGNRSEIAAETTLKLAEGVINTCSANIHTQEVSMQTNCALVDIFEKALQLGAHEDQDFGLEPRLQQLLDQLEDPVQRTKCLEEWITTNHDKWPLLSRMIYTSLK
eukprot:gene338-3705_t